MNQKELPCVNKVVKLMLEDQGIVEDPNEGFVLPTHFEVEATQAEIDWLRVERFLATLTAEDLETLAVGDEEDADIVRRRLDVEEDDYTHNALDTLFMVIGG